MFTIAIGYHHEKVDAKRYFNVWESGLEFVLPQQGRIHGNPVADGWAGAAMREPLAILTIFLSDVPTDTAGSRVACPRLKRRRKGRRRRKKKENEKEEKEEEGK